MIDLLTAIIGLGAFVFGFILFILLWGQDSELEKYYRKTVVTTLREPGYLPKPIGSIPKNIIINSGQRFSPLRTYLLKKWAQLKGEEVPPVILVFGKISEEEQKAFLIQKAFSSIVELSLVDLDFAESMIYYLAYKYYFNSDTIEERIREILRRDFESCEYRNQILNLDSVEYSAKVVLNPPPLKKPILTNLFLPMIREKEKELSYADIMLSQNELWKSLFMTLMDAFATERCAVIFIGSKSADIYFDLLEMNFEDFDIFIFGARGSFINYMQLLCEQIAKDFVEKWSCQYKMWEISGTWEFEIETDCRWNIFQKC